MVRILKVKELEDRRKTLLAKSEMYRQTMKLEIANVRFSAALMKKKLKALRSGSMIAGAVLPLAGGLLWARKRSKEKEKLKVKERGGWLPKIFSGIKLFRQLSPLLAGIAASRQHARQQRGNITQFP
ncbi:MAG: hypothetical protein JWQ71_4881 [Pedosphaera sp.]|nr:hypothetical protein [Pedosphaera sp.]